MGKNAYIQKREADRQKFFVAGCDLATQQMFDMMCLALHAPEVMGKYRTIGAEQLRVIHDAMRNFESKYHDAWMHTPESDYLQEKLDAELREIFGEIQPFNERYPYCREWDYNKPMKKG